MKCVINTTKCGVCLFLHKMCCKMVRKFCEIWKSYGNWKKKKTQKNNKKKLIQIFDKPPQLKLFTSSPQGQASKPCQCPNPRLLYFGLKPINCLCRVSAFQVVQWSWGKRKNSVHPCMHSDDDTERREIRYSCLRQVPILVNGDQIIVNL